MAIAPMNFISSPYGRDLSLPGGAAGAVAPVAPPVPPSALPTWTAAGLDEALFVCAEEPWVDQAILLVLTKLAPMLRAGGFACDEPEGQVVVNRFDDDNVAVHVMRQLPLSDPLGVAAGTRLQACVGFGLSARLGDSSPRPNDGLWHRSVRIMAGVSLSIGYGSPSGERLSDGPPALASVSLVSTGGDLFVTDPTQVTEWWRAACGVEVLRSLRGGGLSLSSLIPDLSGKPEPRTLDELLEDLVERCVEELAP